MKISKIEDIDLSKYKLAYFNGQSLNSSTMCQDDVMALFDGGFQLKKDSWDHDYALLSIALIPKKSRLTECGGDDWNDTPASSNASGFYQYPKGTIFLEGQLGEELVLSEKIDA